jgi:flagellar assembly protein FliH
MSSSTRAQGRTAVLRGSLASHASLARLDSDLRDNVYVNDAFADARLVDPVLARAFDEAVELAGQSAREEGFARGLAEGAQAAQRENQFVLDAELSRLRDADQSRAEQCRLALAALEAAAAQFAEKQALTLRDVEDLVLNAAFDLATTLIGRELEAADLPVRDAVRRALAVLPGDLPATVFVHPLDAAALDDLQLLGEGRSVRFVPDPDVEPGSCVADVGATHVDASLSAALDRVRQVLAR